MAKRFTDTDKWKKPFIRSMEAPYKLLWLYILDDCDHAGIWQVDEDVANIKIGMAIDFKKAAAIFGDHIQVINEGEKWFIQDFIDFQYGELNPENRVHNSIITLHNKYKIKPLKHPLKGVKDKDKDKNKEQDKELYRSFLHLSLSLEDYRKLILEGFLKSEIDDTLDAIENYKKNTQYKNLLLTLRIWMKKDRDRKKSQSNGFMSADQFPTVKAQTP